MMEGRKGEGQGAHLGEKQQQQQQQQQTISLNRLN